MRFHIITLFPEACAGYVEASILGRAVREKKISVKFYNPRTYARARGARVDQRPYGGGPGMVLEPEAMLRAASAALRGTDPKKTLVIFFTPGGEQFSETHAVRWSRRYRDIVLVCGRYEGVDARVAKILKAKHISVGPFILSGGEIPATLVIDALSRQVPGVLGDACSLEDRRVASHEVYTRPEVLVFKGKRYPVPKVLLTGNHQKIEEWKKARTTRPEARV